MLKADRQIDHSELRYFMNTTATRGVIVAIGTAGSGIAMDAALNVVVVAGGSSGNKPIGMLLDDVVDIDLSRQPINWGKSQTVIGNKVSIMTKGWVVTDQVDTVTAGSIAVLSSSGHVTNGVGSVTTPEVGRFRTGKDEAGFATLYVDL